MIKKSGKFMLRFIPARVKRIAQERLLYRPRIKSLKIPSKPLFEGIFFEVRTQCNGTCSFCAAARQFDTRKDTLMPKKLYLKIMKELKQIGYQGRVAFHVNNDPLIFPHIVEYVRIAREHLPSSWIQILTNGKALSVKLADELLREKINELSINYYCDDIYADAPPYLQKVWADVIPRYHPKQDIGFGLGCRNKKFVFNLLKSRSKMVKSNRAGSAPNKKKQLDEWRGFCEYPFTQFNVTTDGRVSKCCADLYFSDPMGNANSESIMDIWNGQKFSDVRRQLLAGNRQAIGTCEKCDFLGVKKEYSLPAKLFRMLIEF
jgi:radical SAM protein with 4Fe4S-binding SPASM domain